MTPVMENSYPVLPSLSTLFSDYDVFDSAAPTPVDNPTFYKPGESSRLPQINSAFHPPATNGAFKMRQSVGPPFNVDQRYTSSSSTPYHHHQISNQGFAECMQSDEMDLATLLWCDNGELRSEPQYADTQRSKWGSTSSLKLPVRTSAAQSSFDSPSRQSTSGTFWLGRHNEHEHDLLGPKSPPPLDTHLDTSAYVEASAHRFHPGPQPHNLHDPTQSPHSYAFPASSSAPSFIPTVSPLASPASPASLSTSPSSSPDIMVHTPTIPLHQPRPGRPIPIIPLSKLASACEEFYMPPSSTRKTFLRSQVPVINHESSDLILSPLSAEFRPHYAPSPHLKPVPLDKAIDNAPYFSYGDNFDEFYAAMNDARHPYSGAGPEIFCACGCMESYRIPRDSTVWPR